MPFKFVYICDLLQRLEDLELEDQDVALPRANKQARYRRIVGEWFGSHRRLIDARDTDLSALLSTLFPERRTDRVYFLQPPGLLKVLCRCLGFGTERLERLKSWQSSSNEDLASWVTSLVKATDPGMAPSNITITEIDDTLERVAARCRFSGPQVRSKAAKPGSGTADTLLKPLIHRLPSHELKWFLRLVLKNFNPVVLEENLVLRHVHFLLPKLLRFQSSFDAAAEVLKATSVRRVPSQPDSNLVKQTLNELAAACFIPKIGVKIGRPNFVKARSVQHCVRLTKNSRWAVEPKYDGEYCQVHIDLSERDCIQIFAKSGKDSTKDRLGLHHWIRQSLRIGSSDCKFKQKCILEGEMVVYNSHTKSMLEFHKTRKHVSRSGLMIGTESDSPTHPHERLMLVCFDVLLIDEEITMACPYSERRQKLKDLVVHLEGCVERIEWGVLDFTRLSERRAKLAIQRQFAKSISRRLEGLVLKPYDGPYISISEAVTGFGGFIKMKKDYIPGLGDTADLAIVGASRDTKEQAIPGVKWNCFTLACISNKDDVLRFGCRPVFQVLDTICRPCITPEDARYISNTAISSAFSNRGDEHHVQNELKTTDFDAAMDTQFIHPYIVEVLGSGFDKPSSKGYYFLRHPRITKVHGDRGIEDVVSFEEIQRMAHEAITLPTDAEAEESKWRQALESASKLKRPIYTTNRSPFSDVTSTRSKSSKLSTPSKSPRDPKTSPLVRVDSCELLQDEPQTRTSGSTRPLTPPPTSSADVPGQGIKQREGGGVRATSLTSLGKRKRVQSNASDTDKTSAKRLSKSQAPKCSPEAQSLRERRILTEITNHATRSTSVQSSQMSFYDASAKEGSSISSTKDAAVNSHYHEPIPNLDECCSAEPKLLRISAQDFLKRSVLYLAPCLRKLPYLTEDLLPSLSPAHISLCLSHWTRDLLYLPPSAPIVGESQAFAEFDKLVLVEARRLKQTCNLIERLKQIKLSRGEEIKLWDWRMTESLAELAAAQGREHGLHSCPCDDEADAEVVIGALDLLGIVETEQSQRRSALAKRVSRCYLGKVAWNCQEGRNSWFPPDEETRDVIVMELL